jgi:RNA polymerase sigma-70 factor (ECF subfamily)
LTGTPPPERGVPWVQASADNRTHERGLVEKARSGDVAAFETLYRQNVGRVYGLCLRLTAKPSLAEELTQQVFIRAWEKLGSFRGESALFSWLYRLATNAVYSEHRTSQRRAARVTPTDDLSPFDDPSPARRPDSGLDLERAIATLPPGARRVFVLHDVEGYRHQEIADMTGVATGTSKAQLHRARRLLREVLKR